jgi:hypothetical protein
MKPLLAHVYEPHRVTYPCYVQPKLNGIRALYQNGRFQSRDQIPFPVGLLAHLSSPLQNVFGPDTILDGELYVHGWPLQRINAAVTPVRRHPTEDTVKVEYHVFDVVDFGKSFHDRVYLSALTKLMSGPIGPINLVNCELALSLRDADELYAEFVASGYEGMMYRLGDCPYTLPNQEWVRGWRANPRSKNFSDKNNRCWHLLKRKSWTDDEFEFLSLNETAGELGERGFQMWVKARNGSPFKVSSGLSQSELDSYLETPPVGRQIKIKYLVLSDKGIPLNATILAVL